MARRIVVDSVTSLDTSAENAVVVTGSHGGIYPAYWLATVGAKAGILNDASVGLDRAGVAGLDYLQGAGFPAAAVSSLTARIGDGADCLSRGRLSHVNHLAAQLGCVPGQSCEAAAECLSRASLARRIIPESHEVRHLVAKGPPAIWAVDSAALVTADDVGCVMLTGSHGALLGGRATFAVRADVRCAVFNDAGIGIDGAGITRLPALDERDIAGATVSAWSARIGDGLSTHRSGILSAVNRTAFNLGARVGMSTMTFVDLFLSSESVAHDD